MLFLSKSILKYYLSEKLLSSQIVQIGPKGHFWPPLFYYPIFSLDSVTFAYHMSLQSHLHPCATNLVEAYSGL